MSAPQMRAVIVTAGPLAEPDRARLHQIIDLYRAAQLSLDMIILPECGSDMMAVERMHDLHRVAVLPGQATAQNNGQHGPSAPQSDRVVGALQALDDSGPPIALVHVDGLDVPKDSSSGAIWVFDAGDAWNGHGAPAGTDLALAAHEALRSRCSGCQAIRLPAAIPQRRGLAGVLPGWVGPFDTQAQQRWSTVLDRVARWGHAPAIGLLLAGPGASGIDVPPLFAPMTIQTEQPPPGALRALGLGILAGHSMVRQTAAIAALLGQGTPILAPESVRDVSEGRWHLPSYATDAQLAEALSEWLTDGPSPALVDATRQTLTAFDYDQKAMQHHVLATLSVLLADTPERPNDPDEPAASVDAQNAIP